MNDREHSVYDDEKYVKLVCDCMDRLSESQRTDPSEKTCGESCNTRKSSYMCQAGCSDGRCGNQLLRRRQPAVELEIFQTADRGLGVRTLEDIKAGTQIIEYVAEVISSEEYVRRSKICAGRPRYFMDLPKTEAYLDATFGGNESRFINHACGKAANCRSQKMVVLKLPPQAPNSRVSDLDDPDVSMSEEEEVHVIIVAKNNILKNSELTLCYGKAEFEKILATVCKCYPKDRKTKRLLRRS